MNINPQIRKIIFGLKVRQLRLEKGYSFADLNKASGLSISYLNEIEKGKKKPKDDKVADLAQALDTQPAYLNSMELSAKLQPVANLLQSAFLNDLPLDIFGLAPSKLIEVVADKPAKVGAFISTIVQIARKYELKEEKFYYALLRSYQELHQNYFEKIETIVAEFVKAEKLPKGPVTLAGMTKILEKKFKYRIDRNGLDAYPRLQNIRSVYLPKKKRLMINRSLTETQEAFLLGKELAYNTLGLKDRSFTSKLIKVNSFDQVLNNFRASYFSGALIMNQESLCADLNGFFNNTKWNPEAFLGIMQKYKASPEMFLHRLTNLMPRFFGIEQLFFLRFNNQFDNDRYQLTKELHLKRSHQPYGNDIREHYCRRWITIWLIKSLRKKQETEGEMVDPIVGIQKSNFYGTNDQYLCFTIARPGHPDPESNISLTIGMLINDQLRTQIKFLDDPAIPVKEVNQTCERCAIPDCTDRVAAPKVIDRKEKEGKIREDLNKLFR